jgi:ornithine decarboxylase
VGKLPIFRQPKIFFANITIGSTLENLRAILRRFEYTSRPFYIFARNRVHSNYNLWMQHLPNVTPYYAVKSNPHPILLRELLTLGSSFDCASHKELEEVTKFNGVDASKIIYANPCKPIRDIRVARNKGSPTTVVDSFEEVEKLVSQNYTGGSLIRIRVNDRNSLMPFSSKFGIDPTRVKQLAQFAKKKGIEIKGVSFHVGSGCNDSLQYKDAIETAQNAMSEIAEDGSQPTIIDIGGGFLPTKDTFACYASVIQKAMAKNTKYKYIAEPGRFFSTTAFDLFVPVIGKKPQYNTDGWRYTLDESLYGQFSCVAFDQKIPVWIRIPKEGSEKKRLSSRGILYGRTCDGLDMIAQSPYMEELEVGDWLWFPMMGAYSSVTASEFNGFPKPPVLDPRDKSLQLPSLYDLSTLKDRLPCGITTVKGVSM